MSDFDKITNMSNVVSQLGAYAYPEIVTPFIAVFDNVATKEQIDEVEKHTKVFGKGRVAKAYDQWQKDYHPREVIMTPKNEVDEKIDWITANLPDTPETVNLKRLKDIASWIERNHIQPVNDSDRWVQASREIKEHILASLQKEGKK